MNELLVKLYNLIPKKIRNKVGKMKALRFLTDIILRQDGKYKEAKVSINRKYNNYLVKFSFVASIKTAAKAYKSGIENTILKNSITLMNSHRNHQDDCTILDVGSNFGYLSLVWSSSICQNKGKVVAFEPNKQVFETLNKTIAINNLDNIINENMALGSKNQKIQLFIENTTSNILNENSSKNYVDIEMLTIDTYLDSKAMDRCDLIKIDVDGIEYEILRGTLDTISRFRPIFIVETNNDTRIIEFFIQLKYKVLDMSLNVYKSGKSIYD